MSRIIMNGTPESGNDMLESHRNWVGNLSERKQRVAKAIAGVLGFGGVGVTGGSMMHKMEYGVWMFPVPVMIASGIIAVAALSYDAHFLPTGIVED